tara:strand:+ start:81 stop:515 length:435 start_codon:yes stop_codon:yes gene_type:complete
MTSLKKTSKGDTDLMYSWQIDPLTRQYFYNKSIPTYSEHCEWMEKALDRKDIFFYTIMSKNRRVGCIRLNIDTANKATVSILLAPKEYGKGFARLALEAVLKAHKEFELKAFIHIENKASQRLFTKCGFIQVDDTTYIKEAECE